MTSAQPLVGTHHAVEGDFDLDVFGAVGVGVADADYGAGVAGVETHPRGGATVISSSIAESAVNQVISRRMVKKQQMRWSPRGAHLLLQLRTRVLNDSLADDFHRWHLGFTHVPDRQTLAA